MVAFTPKDARVDAFAIEVAELAGESKTEVIRTPKRDLERFLEIQIWPAIPANLLGREVQKKEIEDYLGFGPSGV